MCLNEMYRKLVGSPKAFPRGTGQLSSLIEELMQETLASEMAEVLRTRKNGRPEEQVDYCSG
jgi:hypothetical protein